MRVSRDIHLLWTGGWDSTYRLLDLVLCERRTVTPYYLIDHARPSAKTEMDTMDTIRHELETRGFGDLVLPTRFFKRSETVGDPALSEAFMRLSARRQIGKQYDWLGQMAKHNGLAGLEMAVHVDDKVYDHLRDVVVEVGDAMVVPEGRDEWTVFGFYRFPILHLSKLDMERKAKEAGFADIMAMTWFCYQPTKSGEPCGTCNPCSFAIQEGMGYRVPWKGRLRYRFRPATRLIRPATRLIRRVGRVVWRLLPPGPESRKP